MTIDLTKFKIEKCDVVLPIKDIQSLFELSTSTTRNLAIKHKIFSWNEDGRRNGYERGVNVALFIRALTGENATEYQQMKAAHAMEVIMEANYNFAALKNSAENALPEIPKAPRTVEKKRVKASKKDIEGDEF